MKTYTELKKAIGDNKELLQLLQKYKREKNYKLSQLFDENQQNRKLFEYYYNSTVILQTELSQKDTKTPVSTEVTDDFDRKYTHEEKTIKDGIIKIINEKIPKADTEHKVKNVKDELNQLWETYKKIYNDHKGAFDKKITDKYNELAKLVHDNLS
jgi:hypothetical protein